MNKRTTLLQSLTRTVVSSALLFAISLTPVGAENVYVMSYQSTAATACPPSCHTGTSISLFGSTAISTATPAPPLTARRTVYHFSQDGSWSVQPGDYTAFDANGYYTAGLQYPAVYKVYVTKGVTSTPDLVAQMTVDVGSLADASGTGMAAVPTAAFNSTTPINQWILVGYLTNTTPDPIVTFTYVSGTCNNSGNRWYTDVVRFERLDPCAGVANPPAVTGPLAAEQSFVNVTGVVTGAVSLTIYASGNQIGQMNNPAGLPPGQVQVPIDRPLVQTEPITARQTVTNAAGGSCVSDLSPTVPVGGGANPSVQVSLSLWQSPRFAGPVGTSATSNMTNNYFLKASGLAAGYNTAPTDGAVLYPGRCWQTVTFQNGQEADDAILPYTAEHFTNNDTYCALEGLIFSINQATPDGGPYEIYVDQIMNGDVLIEGFEGYSAGQVVLFKAPNQATAPSANATYLPSPNSAEISQLNAAEGTNSLLIRWQFTDANNVRWAHLIANAALGKKYPMLDARKPITIRYLVLPVGERTDWLSLPVPPASQTKYAGQNATFTVVPEGTPPYYYQWYKDGAAIATATDSSYSIPAVTLADAGAYSVSVQDAYCTLMSPSATLSVTSQRTPVKILGITGSTLNYAQGQGTQFVLVKSANIEAGLNTWTRVATNTVSPGSFTVPVGLDGGQMFYSIKTE